jgi:putative acetyltransferase
MGDGALMARSLPQPGLRPYLPSDLPLIVEIFRESIAELTGDDYTPGQQAAWLAAADDEEGFAARLDAALTLVASIVGEPVAFASLKEGEEIDMLYVLPSVARQGIASLLLDAIEKLAAARGSARLRVDASDSARGFFERRGYVAQRRNSVQRGREWLANTTMEKPLGAAAGGSHP